VDTTDDAVVLGGMLEETSITEDSVVTAVTATSLLEEDSAIIGITAPVSPAPASSTTAAAQHKATAHSSKVLGTSVKRKNLTTTDGAVHRAEVDMVFVSNCITGYIIVF
jgi:hypothetical protein